MCHHPSQTPITSCFSLAALTPGWLLIAITCVHVISMFKPFGHRLLEMFSACSLFYTPPTCYMLYVLAFNVRPYRAFRPDASGRHDSIQSQCRDAYQGTFVARKICGKIWNVQRHERPGTGERVHEDLVARRNTLLELKYCNFAAAVAWWQPIRVHSLSDVTANQRSAGRLNCDWLLRSMQSGVNHSLVEKVIVAVLQIPEL